MSGAKQEAEKLMNEGIKVAMQALAEKGEFYPFGRTLKQDGKIAAAEISAGPDAPEANQAVKLIKRGLTDGAKSGAFIATALFYNTILDAGDSKGERNAIAVELDHKNNYSATVFFPYVVADNRLKFGQLIAHEGAYEVFKRLSG